jgi:hypothetical protein
VSLAVAAEAQTQPPAASTDGLPPIPAATYTINLKTRHACATPQTRNRALAEGGLIDVATPSPNTVTVTMTGTAAADSYLCCTGTAAESFELVQDLEITSSDPSIRTVALTLDSALVGFVRSKGRAGACVRRADVSVIPAGGDGTPLAVAYPFLCAEGTNGQLCNQHLPPVEGAALPLGRYTLVASFVLDTRASGVCDSHAVADFAPDTTLPQGWVRTRDPFQGVSKRTFGFSFSVSAAAPGKTVALSSGIRQRPVLAPEAPTRSVRTQAMH